MRYFALLFGDSTLLFYFYRRICNVNHCIMLHIEQIALCIYTKETIGRTSVGTSHSCRAHTDDCREPDRRKGRDGECGGESYQSEQLNRN